LIGGVIPRTLIILGGEGILDRGDGITLVDVGTGLMGRGLALGGGLSRVLTLLDHERFVVAYLEFLGSSHLFLQLIFEEALFGWDRTE